MIRLRGLKISIDKSSRELEKKVKRRLSIPFSDDIEITVVKRSLDCRKKPELFYVYTLDIRTKDEKKVLGKFVKDKDVFETPKDPFSFEIRGIIPMETRPVIIGAGPCGLFCALYLARHGYRPIICERGKDADKRLDDVTGFWNGGPLNPSSNVQFGEGGAGTFSDGKLQTNNNDKDGGVKRVLSEFVRYGGPEDILFEQKAHLGTDVLIDILKNIRHYIEEKGGTFCFEKKLTSLKTHDKIVDLTFEDGEVITTQAAVLAIGNAASDTFESLYKCGLPMMAKPVAMGYRITHPQAMIDEFAYGTSDRDDLPSAPYKLTFKASNGRNVYSFCMCPGGYVIDASSYYGGLCVNGMSYSGRDSGTANSAIIVTSPVLNPDDPFSTLKAQRAIEKKAYDLCEGAIPAQRFTDYKANVATTDSDDINHAVKGAVKGANLRGIYDEDSEEAFISAMERFGRTIPGFDGDEAMLYGVETRTSSPVRIIRDTDTRLSPAGCIYPAGEGAGYAGGIVSASLDGIRTAQAIADAFAPMEDHLG
ncbi:MAG: FAD-dependent oxidoreductase [Eubacterium sp.]|nr:FAD-dependent oxidoreductase [Eubacterium sp.]